MATNLSAVQTANFMLFDDQLRAVILAAPSWQAKMFFKYFSCILAHLMLRLSAS